MLGYESTKPEVTFANDPHCSITLPHLTHTHLSPHSLPLQSLNLAVVGSEIVGLVPLKAMLMSAEHYIQQENLFVLHDHQKLRLVVERLGLSSLHEFKLQDKIIE